MPFGAVHLTPCLSLGDFARFGHVSASRADLPDRRIFQVLQCAIKVEPLMKQFYS
jgi:hypothetical protein